MSKKFIEVYKQKQSIFEQQRENVVINQFKEVYSAMLEAWDVTSVHQLDAQSQVSFLTELNRYWSEDTGISEKGTNFLKKRSALLTEASTPLQKKNYLKNRVTSIVSETLRQTDVKYKIYEVLDEMFEQINGNEISDVMSPDMIAIVLKEAFYKSVEDIIGSVRHELNESLKRKSINESSRAKKVFIKKK